MLGGARVNDMEPASTDTRLLTTISGTCSAVPTRVASMVSPPVVMIVVPVAVDPLTTLDAFKVTDTTARHRLRPPHTPQLSTMPSTQHRPEGSNADGQHTPILSTATLEPPHTPQASTDPVTQQRPTASTLLPSGQQPPDTESMNPVQHTPLTSTTPSSQG